MSVSEEPGPEDLEELFGLTPQEAQSIADALGPVQRFAEAAAGVGAAMEDAPGAGPKLVGVSVQNVATQVELVSSSAETVARAIEFYIRAQQYGTRELFPPPSEVGRQLSTDFEPLVELLAVKNEP